MWAFCLLLCILLLNCLSPNFVWCAAMVCGNNMENCWCQLSARWTMFNEGGQIAPAGYQYRHRLATLDATANSLRAVAELFNEEIAQFAFKQVPSVEFLLHLAVIVQSDPYHKRLVYMIPSSQAFSGRSTPSKCCAVPCMVLLGPCCHRRYAC